MALSPLQIERVREIIGYRSYSAVATLMLGLNTVQETETISDIADWELIRKKNTRITRVDTIYLDIDKDRDRLAIINRIRLRLGLSRIESETDLANLTEIVFSNPVIASVCCD